MAIVVAAALTAVAAAGTAGAQGVPASITVSPTVADPGSVVMVSNGPSSECVGGTGSPSAFVDLYTAGSVTPVNRMPFQSAVTTGGTWSVEVRLPPDLAPGAYRVEAGCYVDSSLNSRFGPAYLPGSLNLRLQDPGQPTASIRRGRPGESLLVDSGDARCMPPAGSPSPRVRVSLLDATKATRAEAEGPVDAATGKWSVGLQVPDLVPQDAEIAAVCLARVAAPAPYARYNVASFAVEADPPVVTTTTPPATSSPTTAGPGVSTTAPPTTPPTAPAPTALPSTPVAVAVVAEPTYTG